MIIIYGAGDYGKRILNVLDKLSVKVDFFCQTLKDDRNSYCGIPLISMEELIKLSEEKIILIAIKDKIISDKIKMQLTNLLIEPMYIYEVGSFVDSNYLYMIEDKRYCLLCNSRKGVWESAGNDYEIFQRLHIIGGGPRKNAICPDCRCSDRERWLFYILNKYTGVFYEDCKVLHFAPEDAVTRRICINSNCDYYSCDIDRKKAVHQVNVTDIPFKDSMFNYVIINHVMEHVEEQQAISELKRVLTTDGKLIMSFPVCIDNETTIEDSAIVTDEDRIREYGQKDHIRLYGMDFKDRMEKYGLDVDIYSPKDFFSDQEIEYYGFIENDIMLICRKANG